MKVRTFKEFDASTEYDGAVSLYEMANLRTKTTGLPFVVWVSPKGQAKHDVRVKVSESASFVPENMKSVGLRPDIHQIDLPGENFTIKARDFKLLKEWSN